VRLRVFHTTRYAYPTQASESHNEARLMPLSDEDQTCLDFRLTTDPPARIFAYDLPSGRVHHFTIRAPHSALTITAESLVVTHRHNPFANLQLVRDDADFYTREGVRQRYSEYLSPTARVQLHPETDRIAAVARKQAGVGTASFLIALTRLLYRVVTYAPGTTDVNSSIQHVLEHKSGVCQDFAHLMLAVCRRQGIPARYVSGYLYTGKRDTSPSEFESAARTLEAPLRERPSEQELEQEQRAPESYIGGDASHAWVECLLPDNQWHGFDPTNNLLTDDHYIKVHFGRDYGDVTPLRGVYRGPFAHTLEVSVRVNLDL
jgi:transglutaminase-like putative cysteine protease